MIDSCLHAYHHDTPPAISQHSVSASTRYSLAYTNSLHVAQAY